MKKKEPYKRGEIDEFSTDPLYIRLKRTKTVHKKTKVTEKPVNSTHFKSPRSSRETIK